MKPYQFIPLSLSLLFFLVFFLLSFIFNDWVDVPDEKLENSYNLPSSLVQSVSSARNDLNLNICEISLKTPFDEKALLSKGWIKSKDGYYSFTEKLTVGNADWMFKFYVTDESKKELFIKVIKVAKYQPVPSPANS